MKNSAASALILSALIPAAMLGAGCGSTPKTTITLPNGASYSGEKDFVFNAGLFEMYNEDGSPKLKAKDVLIDSSASSVIAAQAKAMAESAAAMRSLAEAFLRFAPVPVGTGFRTDVLPPDLRESTETTSLRPQ